MSQIEGIPCAKERAWWAISGQGQCTSGESRRVVKGRDSLLFPTPVDSQEPE